MEEKKKRHGRNDLILVGVLIVVAVLYFLWKALAPAEVGAEVVVQVDGTEYARLPLAEEAELDIAQEGDRHNYLVIRDGKATVSAATCPDELCVHQADISRNGEQITCLPNKVLVTIENGEDSELDIIPR